MEMHLSLCLILHYKVLLLAQWQFSKSEQSQTIALNIKQLLLVAKLYQPLYKYLSFPLYTHIHDMCNLSSKVFIIALPVAIININL